MSQLIVLGNGFDLQCGLKSSYKDFFRKCICDDEYWERVNPLDVNAWQMHKGCNGFWEQLFFMHYKKHRNLANDWFDIETIIKKTLCHINFGEENPALPNRSKALWLNALDNIGHQSYSRPFSPDYGGQTDTIKQYLSNFCSGFINTNYSHIYEKTEDAKKTWVRENLNNYLLQQLNNFERLFCKYIKENIVNPNEERSLDEKAINDEYIVNAVNLLIKLAGFSGEDFKTLAEISEWPAAGLSNDPKILKRVSLMNNLKSLHILSFNYTNPFDIVWGNSPCLYSNVHGKLCRKKCNECNSSTIIFGIDDRIVNSQKTSDTSQDINDDLRLFSKTYRKMFDTSATKSILPPNNNKPLSLKFYGQSFGEADYSYFQSIFDYYTLYDNANIDLIFYYAKGHKQTDAVYRLINEYGKTLANKDQGKNLMHKLLLENRIKIQGLSLNKNEEDTAI